MNLSRNIQFTPKAFEDLVEWGKENRKVFSKIAELIEEIRREPFLGKGKPEPLKNNLQGFWSRRITDVHRIVYTVSDDVIIFYSLRDHYGDK